MISIEQVSARLKELRPGVPTSLSIYIQDGGYVSGDLHAHVDGGIEVIHFEMGGADGPADVGERLAMTTAGLMTQLERGEWDRPVREEAPDAPR